MDKSDLMWKILAASVLPSLMWVNSISSQLAVAEKSLMSLEKRVSNLEEESKTTGRLVVQNASRLQSIAETLTRIHQTLDDTRSDIRSINQRLLGGPQ